LDYSSSTPAQENILPFEESDSDHTDTDEVTDGIDEADTELGTNDIVARAVQQYGCTVTTSDMRDEDLAEEQSIEQFFSGSCECKLGPGNTPCSRSISMEHYMNIRAQMRELTHDQLDLVVMSQLMMNTESGTSTHRNKERQRTYSVFYHSGQRICLMTFLFIHTIGRCRFKSLKSHFQARGLEPRIHGNKGKHRPTGLSLEEIKGVVKFITNYAGNTTRICNNLERIIKVNNFSRTSVI